MTRFLLVCLGGAVGSGARYLISLGAVSLFGARYPFGTLIVNLAGSFLIGVAMQTLPPSGLRVFVTTGVLGGFTTYSAFNYETLQLPTAIAAVNVVATFTGCLIAGMAGMALAKR